VLTRLALPALDPALDELAPDARARVARLWGNRARNERHTSAVFGALQRVLVEQGAAAPVVELAHRAVSDELGHADLCEAVAARYAPAPFGADDGPAADAEPEALRPPAAPSFHGCTERENGLLFVVLQCCLNETIAAAYLRTCLEQARGAVARTAVRELLKDEVTHSRIGWAHLASDRVDEPLRRVVAEAMPELLRTIERVWLADPGGIHAAAPPGHGSLRIAEIGDVVRDTVEAIVVPGLTHIGVDPRPSAAWLAAARG
jgi:hypothetical protein